MDAISTEILCAGPFISEWLSLFYLALLQDEIPSECPNMDVCCLLITFANGLDPDLNYQNVSPDLDPNHLTL